MNKIFGFAQTVDIFIMERNPQKNVQFVIIRKIILNNIGDFFDIYCQWEKVEYLKKY